MSKNDFVSEIKLIPHRQENVYRYLSDLNNLSKIKERVSDPAFQERLKQASEKYDSVNIQKQLENLTFDTDSMTVSGSPVGDVCLRIIEREEPKTIKLVGEGTPIGVTMWIQLLPVDAFTSKMKLTLRAELNMFMRGMVSKPLQQGVDKIAEMLASLPYED